MIMEIKTPHNELELVTRRELAELHKIGVSSVDLIPEDELPRVHLGKSIRFTIKSINAFIQRHETKNTTLSNETIWRLKKMLRSVLQSILYRIINEHPAFGSIHISFVFHENKLKSFEFTKTEKSLFNKEP
jgi:predicted DNA-binding transcriptional regulator AlpA